MITPILEKWLLSGHAKNKIHWLGFGMFTQIQIPTDSFIVIHKIYWNCFLNQKNEDIRKLTWKQFFEFNEYQLKIQSDKEAPMFYNFRNEINFLDFTCCDADTPPAPAIGTACVRFNNGEFGSTFTFNFTFFPLGSFLADVDITSLATSLINIQTALTIFQPGWTVTGTTDFLGNQCFTFTTTTPGKAFNLIPIQILPPLTPPPGFVATPGILLGGSNGLIGKPIILDDLINIDQFNSSILLTTKKPIIFDTFISAYDYLNITISRNALLPNGGINFGLVNSKSNEKQIPFGVFGQLVLLEVSLIGTGGTIDNLNPPGAELKNTPLLTNNVYNYHQDLDAPNGLGDNGSFLQNPQGGIRLEHSDYVTNPLMGFEYCIIQKNEAGKLSSL